MSSKRASLFIVIQLLLASWAAIGLSSAAGEPTTTISINSPYHGNTTNGAHAYVGQNPNFSLSVSSAVNSSIINTEYEITRDGLTTTHNYSSSVTITANYSTNIALRYRSNSTTGLESWKSLSLTVDADSPVLSLSSGGDQPLRYTSNPSVFVTSSQTPLSIVCSDNRSGLDTVSGQIGNSSISGTNGVLLLSPSNLPAGINGSSPFTLDVSCKDEVDNFANQSYSIILDDSTPTLTVQEHGTRVGACVSSDWWLSPQAADNHTLTVIEKQNGSTWEQVSTSIGIPENFNGTVTLRASDSVGFHSSSQSWTVAVDTLPPVITASLNQTALVTSSTDSCGVSNHEYRWETLTGTTFGWTSVQGSQTIPASLNGSIVRAQIRSTDAIGNTNSTTTGWVNTNGSSPYSSVTVLSDRIGTTISPEASFLITPVGYQATANWEIFVNNQTFDSGTISTQTTLQDDFSDGDYIELSINTTDALGDSSSFSWNWNVDGANGHQLSISVSGSSINSTGLILGPSGRLVPGAPSDDGSGVGGSHASCSWDDANWFDVPSGSIFAPSTASGVIQSYMFGCRSVDLLGNQGPITWLNGSVDSEAPSISLQPSAGETIGVDSVLTINMSDTNGLGVGLLRLQWTNGTSNTYSNITLGTANWSSSLSQLFSGLSDGSVTADVIVSDAVGNSDSIQGRSWSLNTSQPFISVVLSGDSHGTFISSDSTEITLTPPSGGWTGIWMHYSLTDSAGSTVASGNVSTSTTLQPTSLPGGNTWLNTTTGDTLGRVQQQGWIFYVDDTNSQSPILDIVGLNSTINSATWIGTGSQFRVRGIGDDAFGAGANQASCSWDGTSWFSTSEGSLLTPSISSGTHQSISLRCKSVDLLGNAGPLSWLNVSADAINPTQTLVPTSGAYIAPNSVISMSVSDHSGIQSSVLSLSWTDGQNSWQSSIPIASTTWSSSLSAIRSNLSDGSITATLYTIDNLGNEAYITGRSWTLNTTQPLASVSVTGSVVGSYVASDGFTIHLTPPSSGGSLGWSLYTLEHSNGSTIASGNISQASQIDPTPLPSGQIWLNVTSHDIFSRNQTQSWVYFVDTSVGTLPVIGLQGAYTNQSGDPILGPTGRLLVTSMLDDVGGVGSSHASCTWNGEDWFTTTQNSPLTPQSSSGSVIPYTLGCSVVDLVGNTGQVQWMNGTVDVENPTVTYSIGSGSLLSQNSTFTVSCSDSNGCTLSEISALFNNGSVTTWYSMTISGSSAGVSLSSFLNVTESGTVTFYTNAQDQITNAINFTSSSFQYLHDVPTVSVVVQSNHSGAYIDGDLTFEIVPSSGWMSGISVNLTVEHSADSSPLYSGAVNQTLATQSYTDLSEGQLWTNGSICDILGRCSSTSVQLLIDRTGPSTPSFSVSGGHLLSNLSYIVQGSEPVSLSSGSDTASGIHQTICSSSNGQVTFSSQQVSVLMQSLVLSDAWSTIQCTSTDSVGNSGNSLQFTVFRDDTTPTVSISDGSTSSVVAPSNWFNASCSDDILYDGMEFEIRSSGSVVYQLNTSGDISVRYGTISALGTGGQLDFTLTCTDAAGNQYVDNRNLEWLPELSASTISVGGVQVGSTHYVANSQSVTLSNSRSDVYHEIRYIVNGTAGDWERVNSTSFTFDLATQNGLDTASLRLEARVLHTGSNLVNSSISGLMVIDFSGPSVTLNSNPILSNGSIIDLGATDSGVGISHYIWSWDNGTNQQSSVITDVRLSSSSSSSSWLSLQAVDRLGNVGDTITASITRDVTPPVISIESTHPGYIGPNSTFDVDISETTGLAWSTLQFSASNGQNHLIASNVSSYQITSTDFPSWVWNHSTVNLVVEVESTSEIYVSHSLTLIPDNVAPQVSIDSIQSTFLYGSNTSNYSQLYLSTPVDISHMCVKVGSNQALAASSDCLSTWQSAYQYDRTAGAYVMVVNATDFSGNNRITIFNLQHHSTLPQISDVIPSVLRPTVSQGYNFSSAFPASVTTYWDGSQIQNQGGSFTVPTGSGDHLLVVNVTDAVGLSFERSWTITLDGVAPTISLEGAFYSGTDFGSDTILYINSSDAISDVYRVNLTIASSTSTCTNEWQPISTSFAINGTLSSLISPNTCALLQSSSSSVTTNIVVEDSLGNIRSSSDSMIYHGDTLPPTWTTENVVTGTQFVLAGPHSNFTCNAAPGTIQPYIEISWSGLGGIISGANVTGVSGDGVLVCEITDAFGNTAVGSINLTFDSTPATCAPQQFVLSNTTTFVLPATRTTIFSCSDNLAGIRSIGWQSQGAIVPWSLLQNSSWSAPPPVASPSNLLIVDEVGNVYSESFDIVFDDLAPELTVSAISGISFDENIARPDGHFIASCIDAVGVNCLMTIIQIDSNTNTVLSSQIRYNSGNISLSLPTGSSNLRLDIITEDEIGNSQSTSILLFIDGTPPVIQVTARSPSTAMPMPSGLIADDGIITLDNLASLDVNYSLSDGFTLSCPSLNQVYTGPLQTEYDLSNYELSNCPQISFELSAVDHVQNEFNQVWYFSLDHLQPSVDYSLDTSCSWDAGPHFDIQSSCDIDITLTDDDDQNLSSIYSVNIIIDGEVVETQQIYRSKTINLVNYPNSIVVISVTGADLVGRPVANNALHLDTLDHLTPIWTGLICAGNSVCGWTEQIVSAKTSDHIGIITPFQEAPIVESNIVFENTLTSYQFSTNNFSADAIPDGIYMITPYFKDAAGREFSQERVPFVYDNVAPIIEIVETQSNGLLNGSTILACDVCRLVWTIDEITNFSTTTNHGSVIQDVGQYTLQTATLGNNIIEISATDSFGRTTTIEYNTIPIQTTEINPVESMLSGSGMNLQCLESAAVDDIRQVTCLWTRTESTIDTIPIQIEVDIDRQELRNVDIVIEKSGGSTEVMDAQIGLMTLSEIHHYTSSFVLRVSDDYSQVNPIHFSVIEHTLPWSNQSMLDPQLSEDDNVSTFEVQIYPPDAEGEYHMLKRGFVNLQDLFSCSSYYSFARHHEISVSTYVDNCEILYDTWRIRTDGSISFDVFVNHSSVRSSFGSDLGNHSAPLFNLEQFSILMSYQDSFGITGVSEIDESTVLQEDVLRTDDSPPSFSSTAQCPLGYVSSNWQNSDGFLQSQRTSPLSDCAENIQDSDGINRIVWSFRFEEGAEVFTSEIQCKSTYFPRNWDFEKAIDADYCEPPSETFPTGVFDVTIRPWIVDESIFVRNPDSFRLIEDGVYAKSIEIESCTGDTDCGFVEYILYDVLVTSSLNPASEVQNSIDLVENAKSFSGSTAFLAFLLMCLLGLIGVSYSVYIRFKLGKSQIPLDQQESMHDKDENLDIRTLRRTYFWRPAVLEKIMSDYQIKDEDGFLLHSVEFDRDGNKYLSKVEFIEAAESWNKSN